MPVPKRKFKGPANVMNFSRLIECVNFHGKLSIYQINWNLHEYLNIEASLIIFSNIFNLYLLRKIVTMDFQVEDCHTNKIPRSYKLLTLRRIDLILKIHLNFTL